MPTENDGHLERREYDPGKGEIDRPLSGPESANLGYETTDVNVGGVVVFLGGLFGFVLIFFFFCFGMGRLINNGLNHDDGPADKWHTTGQIFAGAKSTGGRRENLKSAAAMKQQELQQMTASFPSPRLDIDDGNQATADLHAREDLLLDHYSRTDSPAGGAPELRIPIDRAMELIAERGLPVSVAAPQSRPLAEDHAPLIQVPLTSGFARTGYELDTIEAREQKMAYGKADASAHAELRSTR